VYRQSTSRGHHFSCAKSLQREAGSEVQVHTGFGGGDCGAQFSSGLTYLLFLLPQTDAVYVSPCASWGWTLGPQVQSQLRYLRGETPAPDDLLLPKRWSPEHSKKRSIKRKRMRLDSYSCGRTDRNDCGRVERDAELRAEWGDVRLLSLLGYSPAQQPTRILKTMEPLRQILDRASTSSGLKSRNAFAYFPSTSSWTRPSNRVAAGQTLSGITIRPIRHETYRCWFSLH